MQTLRLKPTGLANPGTIHRFIGMGQGLFRQEAVGQVVGQVWNRPDAFLLSKPGPLVGNPDPLLTLFTTISTYIKIESSFL